MTVPFGLGVFLPYEGEPRTFAPLVEGAGFGWLAYGEHVLFRRPIMNAFVTLAAASAVTDRIRLLSALTLLPLYPAALAAKLASSLDVLSRGRFDFGIGVGGEVAAEFDACGVRLADRGRLVDAALPVMRALFEGGDGAGGGGAGDDAVMLPGPVQQPGPPIWVGGRSDAALRRAARAGDVWLPYLVTPEQLAAGTEKLRAFEAASPPRAEPVRASAVCFVAVDRDGLAAERRGKAFVSRLYSIDEARISRYVVAGTPAAVVERLGEYRDAGAGSVMLNLCAEGPEADTMVELAGREVRPAFQP